MSSATGKQVLSLIRNGDYAHAGEEEAIATVFRDIAPCTERRILDVGCGLGGTANFIARHGWGNVTGIDIDRDTIEYARKRYPQQEFVCCPSDTLTSHLTPSFDLVVMFNTLYCFPNQQCSLEQAQAVTVPGGHLTIFDYSALSRTPQVRAFYESYARTHWVPLMTDEIETTLKGAGWQLEALHDLTSEYSRWYRELVDKIDSCKDRITAEHGARWFEYARHRYQVLLDAIEAGIIGGVIIHAKKNDGDVAV